MVNLVAPGDPVYPAGLRDLEDPPPLYIKGSILDRPHVAIVGTRRCTRYGVGLAESSARAVSDAGWVVVSGLARGIDAAAHRGSISSRAPGVAIFGSGIDRIYPAENRQLASDLLANGGALVSEYPGDTPPERWRFPARNRLIAAIAGAVVVVEAALKGGAQITAMAAAEIGRPVFAFPGDVDRPASEGTNRLIRDGAIPVLGSGDLMEELSLLSGFESVRVIGDDEAVIPESGIDLDELPDRWKCSASEALVRLARLEGDGVVARQGDRVVPIPRTHLEKPIP